MEDESRCRKGIYHQFEVSRDLPDAIIEVCILCGKKVVYYKDNSGRIDNSKYLQDHKRDFVQPFGKDRKLFIKLWGEESIDRAIEWHQRKIDKEKREDIRKELIERRIWLRKKAGKTDPPPPLIKKTGFQNNKKQ